MHGLQDLGCYLRCRTGEKTKSDNERSTNCSLAPCRAIEHTAVVDGLALQAGLQVGFPAAVEAFVTLSHVL